MKSLRHLRDGTIAAIIGMTLVEVTPLIAENIKAEELLQEVKEQYRELTNPDYVQNAIRSYIQR